MKPLSTIYKNCINCGIFPDIWKKSNVIPIYKKGDKQLINNYRPVSLLPVFGKIFERLIFNNIYNFFEMHNLLNPSQSGFRPHDSCVYQLLSITHEIFKTFDCNPPLDVRAVFLDISKAFDKVWHKGLIYKLQSLGISGNLLNLIKSFLSDRYQHVLLNGQSFEWPISDGMTSKVKLFADDTSLFSVVHNIDQSATQLKEIKRKYW